MNSAKQYQFSVRAAGAVLTGCVTWLLLFSQFSTNVTRMLLDPAYVVPEESSLLTFRVREMNPGSGDWWQAGEDSTHFYHRIDSEGILYSVYPGVQAAHCPGFSVDDVSTWCTSFRKDRLKSEVPSRNSLAWLLH